MMAAVIGFDLLADVHPADVLDTVGVDEATALNVADFLSIGERRGDVDRAAWIIPVVGRGDRAAGHDTAEGTERNSSAHPDTAAGLGRRLAGAQDEGGQGSRAASLHRSTHR